MDDKIFRTYEEQIDTLKKRGIDFDFQDAEKYAINYFQNIGYYRLINGYKKLFLIQNDGAEREDVYRPGTRVNEIHALYVFDSDLRDIVLRYILKVEAHIKSLIAYEISQKYGHDNYLRYKNFNIERRDAYKKIPEVIAEVHKSLSARINDPSITHYLSKYGYVPMWVMNNILTFGTISKFYSVMKTPDRQNIAKKFKINDMCLENFLLYLTAVRNTAAHANRLYCFRVNRPLIDTDLHRMLNLEKINGEYKCGKRDFFASILALKKLLSNNEFNALMNKIRSLLAELEKHLYTISIEDVKKSMGLPLNFQDLFISSAIHKASKHRDNKK